MRFVSRVGGTADMARRVLETVRALPSARFIADDMSYLDIDMMQIVGHRQWTDEYLVALGAFRGIRLATFDRALVSHHAGTVDLVPDGS